MPTIVRIAREGEAAELAALHLLVWRATYGEYINPAALEDDTERRIGTWQRYIASPEPPLVAEVDGVLVGCIMVGRSRNLHRVPVELPEVELQALNVLPRFHGFGVARELVDAALPPGPACLWVVERNARAIAFYEKLGFISTAHRIVDDRLWVTETLMLRGANNE